MSNNQSLKILLLVIALTAILSIKIQSDNNNSITTSLCHKYFSINPSVSKYLSSIINIKASDSGKFSKTKKEIIFLIDTSGSMEGEKIDNVKEFLRVMLNYMSESDKLLFVLFSSDVEIFSNSGYFFNVANSKDIILEKVNSIRAYGGTNIKLALNAAFNLFKDSDKNNNSKNDSIRNIILLTDGEDNNRDGLIEYLATIQDDSINTSHAIHSVGYGVEHDTEILKRISELGRGNYLSISDSENIKKEIANVLGSILSVFERNLKVKIVLKNGVKVNKSLSRFFKPVNNEPNAWVYEHPTVSYGMNYNFGFELEVDNNPNLFKNFNESLVDLYMKRDKKEYEKITDIPSVKIDFELNEAIMNNQSNINKTCLGNYIIIENGIIIEKNIELLDNDDLEVAKQNIDERIKYLKNEKIDEVDIINISHELEELKLNYSKKSVKESKMYTNNYYMKHTANYGTYEKSRGIAQQQMIDDM